MRSLSLALLAVLSPLASAADRPAQDTDLPVVRVGIEHSKPLRDSAEKSATGKNFSHLVQKEDRKFVTHLHVDANGRTSLACEEDHLADAGTPEIQAAGRDK